MYFPGRMLEAEGALIWVDRAGEVTPITDFGRLLDTPRISGDGTRVAFRAPAPECNVWVHDVERDVTTLVTHESDNHGLAWSPNDERIAFARPASGLWEVVATPPDGAGPVESLCEDVIPRGFVADYSPDGRHVLVVSHRDQTNADVEVVDAASGEVTPLVHTRFTENEASLSPDGRYFAYVSDESGLPEVYIQPFPAGGRRSQVTTGGRQRARLVSQTAKKLYFRERPTA